MKHSAATKKLELKLLNVLNLIELQIKAQLNGFVRLEHSINYAHFPGSLLVSCYFSADEYFTKAKVEQRFFQQKLQGLLLKQGILLKNASQNLHFHLV